MKKMAAGMISVRDAIESGYSNLSTIRSEIIEWLYRKGPRRKADNTYTTFYLWEIVRALDLISVPDLSEIPSDIAQRLVCANLQVNSVSRETRRENALAKLRPAAAALSKAGLMGVSEKILTDVQGVDSMYRIPGAFE